MKKNKLIVYGVASLLLCGCAKEIPTIPIETVPVDTSAEVTSVESTPEAETEAESVETSTVEETTTEKEETTEGFIHITEEEPTEEEHQFTSRVIEMPTIPTDDDNDGDDESDAVVNDTFGITGLSLFGYGNIPNDYSDVFQVASLVPGSFTEEGYISDLQLYDLDSNLWLAAYTLTTAKSEDNDKNVKWMLTSFQAGDSKLGNTTCVYEFDGETEDKPSAYIEQINRKLWYVIEDGDSITAYNYDGAARLHNVLSLPNTEGLFRDKNDGYYYANNGVIMTINPGNKDAASVKLSESFYVNKISGIYDYPYGNTKAIVRGVDKDGNENSASIDLDTGDILYTGKIDYYSACDNGILMLESFENGINSEIRVYRNGYADVSYIANGNVKLNSQILSDDAVLLYYTEKSMDGGLLYHFYKYNEKHVIKANTNIRTSAGSQVAGEAVVMKDGKIMLPIQSADGTISFYIWNPVLVVSSEPQLKVSAVSDTTKYKK